jgi:DnaA family protein
VGTRVWLTDWCADYKHMQLNQIPLPFDKFNRYDIDSFLPGKNQDVLGQLNELVRDTTSKNILIWGLVGTGKSHILQAMCTAITNNNKSAAYIPLTEINDLSPGMLEGLEGMDLVCVDDIDCLAGISEWEQAMFHLFNRIRDSKGCLLISAGQNPKNLLINLPDLKSRLSWDLVYRLELLDETSLFEALKIRANQRRFDLPDEVVDYLFKRVSRDPHHLFNLLDDIDKASISEKKKITIPFVKRLLSV